MYGSSENEIQLDERMGGKTKPSIAQEDQPTYQGLIFGDGNNNLLPVYKLFTLTFNFFASSFSRNCNSQRFASFARLIQAEINVITLIPHSSSAKKTTKILYLQAFRSFF